MTRGKLALLMILKDEAETIKDVIGAFWLNGKPLYDRLIISIDRNTEDNTYEIVSQFTDEISFFKWEDDFSKPRNELIKKVEKDWFIMFPDGHEVMSAPGNQAMDLFLSNPPKQSNLFAPWIEINVDQFGIPEILFQRPIFFRNTGKVEWRRKAHNFLYDSEGEENNTQKPCMAIWDMKFVHNTSKKRKKMRAEMRVDMNPKRHEEFLEENPEDERELFYLAESQEQMGNYQKSIELRNKLFGKIDGIKRDTAAQVCISNMNVLIHEKQYKDAIQCGLKGLRNRWDRAELYYFMGVAAYESKEYEEAIHWYLCATDLHLCDTKYFLMAKTYNWLPWDGIMNCKRMIGDYEGAIEAAKRIVTKWKYNKKTGEPCPEIMNNIKILEERIELDKKELKAQEILSETPGYLDSMIGELNKTVNVDNNQINIV